MKAKDIQNVFFLNTKKKDFYTCILSQHSIVAVRIILYTYFLVINTFFILLNKDRAVALEKSGFPSVIVILSGGNWTTPYTFKNLREIVKNIRNWGKEPWVFLLCTVWRNAELLSHTVCEKSVPAYINTFFHRFLQISIFF